MSNSLHLKIYLYFFFNVLFSSFVNSSFVIYNDRYLDYVLLSFITVLKPYNCLCRPQILHEKWIFLFRWYWRTAPWFKTWQLWNARIYKLSSLVLAHPFQFLMKWSMFLLTSVSYYVFLWIFNRYQMIEDKLKLSTYLSWTFCSCTIGILHYHY